MDSQRHSALMPAINNNNLLQQQNRRQPNVLDKIANAAAETQVGKAIIGAANKHNTERNALPNATEQTRPAGMDASLSRGEQIWNAAAQTGRIPGGIAQGTNKVFAAPGIAMESLPQNVRETLHIGGAQRPLVMPDGTRLYGSPHAAGKPITEAAGAINTGIQNWTDSWVPQAQTAAADFVAKASDALGEAVPGTALAITTGGLSATSALVGNALSWTAGGANAFSTEMLEGSGDVGRAAIAAATEWGAEAAGGKIFGTLAGKAASPVAQFAVNSLGEGAEEVMSGVTQAVLTGQSYTTAQAAEDFALGTAVGAAIGSGVSVINATSEGITKSRVQHDVNARISDAAKADVNDVKSLLSHGNDSGASAVIAQDSLTALQKQVANPINTGPQQTSAIPADIAEKYGLRTAEEGANPLEVTVKNSYEGLVEPTVSQLAAPEVSLAERALIDPNNVDAETLANPRAVYQYAQEDIYLKPGTDMENSLFTNRGQANQFFRNGSFPASGAGTSNEGSGVYSGLTPYVTDLYGPTGKLVDNPYSNQGIRQKAVEADYPIGVVLQQSLNLNEIRSPLERKSQPAQKKDVQNNTVDVVPEGERRVRYDDKGRGFITEVINNPNDVKAVGLNFGRTSITDATPIQYADSSQSALLNTADIITNAARSTMESKGSNANSTASEQAKSARTLNTDEALARESATGEYVIPQLINTNEVTTIANAGDGREAVSRTTTERAAQSATLVESSHEATATALPNSRNEAAEGRVSLGMSNEEVARTTSENAQGSSEAFSHERTPNMPSAPEKTSKTTTKEPPTATEEPPLKRPDPDTPIEETPSADKGRTPDVPTEERSGETPEERAARIWMPESVMQKNISSNMQRKDRDEKIPTYDFNLSRGPGSQGRVYETTGYKQTFGGLSSF